MKLAIPRRAWHSLPHGASPFGLLTATLLKTTTIFKAIKCRIEAAFGASVGRVKEDTGAEHVRRNTKYRPKQRNQCSPEFFYLSP